MKYLVLLLILFSSAVSPHAWGENEGGSSGTRGGGDIRKNQNDYTSRTGREMKRQVELFLRVLRKNKQYVADDRHPLLDDRFLADVQGMADGEYNVVKKSGECGYAPDGFPLTASTRNGIPFDSICVDEVTARNQGVDTASLVGLLLHEHCRHLSSFCEDNSQKLIDDVKVLYRDVMNFPVNGECRIARRNLSGEREIKSVHFRTTDLVERGVRFEAFERSLELTARRSEESREFQVTLQVRRIHSTQVETPWKPVTTVAPIVTSRDADALWYRPDFLFDLSDDSGAIRCRTFPSPRGDAYWRIQIPTVEVLDELFP